MSCGAPANSANMVANLALESGCLGVADWAATENALEKMGGVTAQPIPALIAPGTTDGSGFMTAPIMGPVGIPFDLGTGADPIWLDRFFRVMTRGNVTAETILDAGPPAVVRRTYRYDPTLDELAFTGRFGIQDIRQPLVWTLYGMHLGGLTVTAAAGAFVEARIAGEAMSFSFYAPYPVADVGNLGTYPGPQLRGQASNDYRNHVLYVKIVNVGDPLTPAPPRSYTPLQFKVEAIEGGGVPTFPGQTYYQEYEEQDDGSQVAVWRDYHDENGFDVGNVDLAGNRLPVQIVFPGTLADTAAAVAVDDVWAMSPRDVPPLVATYSDAQGFTLAHKRVTVTYPGGDAEELERDDLTVSWAHPLAVAYSKASNYVNRVDRTDEQMLTVSVNRGVTSRRFQEAVFSKMPLDIRIDCEGSQFGIPSVVENEAAPRRSFGIDIPAATVANATMAISAAAPVTEALAFQSSSQGFSFTVTEALDP